MNVAVEQPDTGSPWLVEIWKYREGNMYVALCCLGGVVVIHALLQMVEEKPAQVQNVSQNSSKP